MVCGVAVLAAAVWAQSGSAEIIRDKWGVPHIYAASEAEGFYGLGWATAEDRLLQMELFRRGARAGGWRRSTARSFSSRTGGSA